MALPLEPSDAQLRNLLHDAVRRVVAHVGSLPAQPADGTAGAAAVARALIEREPPEEGAEAGPLLDLLFEKAIPASFNNAGPGFLAYIPGGGQPYAAAADLDLRRRQPLHGRLRARPRARPARDERDPLVRAHRRLPARTPAGS